MNGGEAIFLPKKDYHHLFRLTFSAMMLALALITSFLGHFISFPFFSSLKLTIDISVVFLIACAFFVSFGWALTITVAQALINLMWDSVNFIGVLTAFLANVLMISFTKLYFHFLARAKLRWVLIFTLASLSNSLVLTTLNGLLITPMYWYYFGYVKTPSFLVVEKVYNQTPSVHFFLLGIPNYWIGIFCLFSFFNIVKFGLVSIIATPVMHAFQKFYWKRSFMISNYKGKTKAWSLDQA